MSNRQALLVAVESVYREVVQAGGVAATSIYVQRTTPISESSLPAANLRRRIDEPQEDVAGRGNTARLMLDVFLYAAGEGRFDTLDPIDEALRVGLSSLKAAHYFINAIRVATSWDADDMADPMASARIGISIDYVA